MIEKKNRQPVRKRRRLLQYRRRKREALWRVLKKHGHFMISNRMKNEVWRLIQDENYLKVMV